MKISPFNINRVSQHYKQISQYDLVSSLFLKNVYQVPQLEKIVVHSSTKNVLAEGNTLVSLLLALEQITGQKPYYTKSKESIASFKLRENTFLGVKVTIRGNRMYEFLDRFITLALPRKSDFQGFSYANFNETGNFTIGSSDVLMFPEIDLNFEKYKKVTGVDIILVTNAKTKKEAYFLLQSLNFLFKK